MGKKAVAVAGASGEHTIFKVSYSDCEGYC